MHIDQKWYNLSSNWNISIFLMLIFNYNYVLIKSNKSIWQLILPLTLPFTIRHIYFGNISCSLTVAGIGPLASCSVHMQTRTFLKIPYGKQRPILKLNYLFEALRTTSSFRFERSTSPTLLSFSTVS
jgi:hypothetical protein